MEGNVIQCRKKQTAEQKIESVVLDVGVSCEDVEASLI